MFRQGGENGGKSLSLSRTFLFTRSATSAKCLHACDTCTYSVCQWYKEKQQRAFCVQFSTFHMAPEILIVSL
jgi:hypothetical protein